MGKIIVGVLLAVVVCIAAFLLSFFSDQMRDGDVAFTVIVGLAAAVLLFLLYLSERRR
jgi:hypothetical protein